VTPFSRENASKGLERPDHCGSSRRTVRHGGWFLQRPFLRHTECPTTQGAVILPMLTRRLASPAFRVFTLFLCVSVFSWGLAAKLSLYKAPTGSHSETVAKLIQDRQLNKKKIGELQQIGQRHESRFATQPGASLLVPEYSAARIRQICPRAACFLKFYPHALLFRPPPLKL
jgi:hypothetical protein